MFYLKSVQEVQSPEEFYLNNPLKAVLILKYFLLDLFRFSFNVNRPCPF